MWANKLLDKKRLAQTISAKLDGINCKDGFVEQQSSKRTINKEKMGPNYFLVGGPWPNYA